MNRGGELVNFSYLYLRPRNPSTSKIIIALLEFYFDRENDKSTRDTLLSEFFEKCRANNAITGLRELPL